MRRKEREVIGKDKVEEIILKGEIVHVGMCSNNMPYVVPVNYGYKDNVIYFHCALEGKKIDILKANENVAFEIVSEQELVVGKEACNYTAKYSSVFGTGIAEIITNKDEKIKGLDILMSQYNKEISFTYKEKAVDKVHVIKINIKEITGKSSK